jgi:xylan 1,4-beta-xylosidase
VPLRNPVIPGFHPDPSVCRVGDDFWLVTSSFTLSPGVPLFRSTDLVRWTQVGNVLDRPSQLDLSGTRDWSSLGIYAPTIRHRDGTFYMITTLATAAGARNFFVTTDDPLGPWSDPVIVEAVGIDPDLAWDDDGRCWVHSSGPGHILRVEIDERTGAALGDAVPTWSGTGLQYPEAPHLLQRDGTWYLLIAEGGTERGHAVSIARGPSPEGPWEGCPANPIVSHRSTDRPVQNTGHADLVEGADGRWWAVLLGVRPLGITPGFHVLGRETFLAPVEWEDGWPVVGAVEAVGDGPSADDSWDGGDDFVNEALHPRWVGVRRSPGSVATAGRGRLVLHGGAADLDDPTPALVGRRQQHHGCRARVTVDAAAADEAGLAVYLDDEAHYAVAVRGGEVVVRARSAPFDQVVASAPCGPGPVVLDVEAVPNGSSPSDGAHAAGPDVLRFGVDGRVLAELDGRHLSTEVRGGFLGRLIGMYAVGGDATFERFRYEQTATGA